MYLGRDILAKKIFPALTKDHAYRLLRALAFMAWTVALAGIGAWVYITKDTAVSPDLPPLSIAGLREIYIHYGNNQEQAATLQSHLLKRSVSVPGLIKVPESSQDIRYANDRDRSIAEALQRYLMREEGITIPNLKNLWDMGYHNVPSGRIEIYLR